MSVSMEPIMEDCDKACGSRAKWVVKKNGVAVGKYCLQCANRIALSLAKPLATEPVKEAKSA